MSFKKIDENTVEITTTKVVDLYILKKRKTEITKELARKYTKKELIELGKNYIEEINNPLVYELEEINNSLNEWR